MDRTSFPEINEKNLIIRNGSLRLFMLLGIVLHTALAYFPLQWEVWAFQDPTALP
jgi:hypothetical protein